MISKSVVTLAVGNDYYRQLAKNLLLSFLKWNDPQEIHFQLITDDPDFYSDLKGISGISIQKIDLKEEDRSFTSKLRLSEYINAQHNLFIDCDCIVYKSLNNVFEKFHGKEFSAVGETRITGEFFGDIETIIKKFNISYLPQFVGSVYYYTNSDVSKNIFLKASQLKESYDELGLVRLRGKENEEPLLAIAMALNNQTPAEEDGSVKADYMHFRKCYTNVITGKLKLLPLSTYKYKHIIFNPSIIHFNANFSDTWIYKLEQDRLSYQNNYSILNKLTGLFFIKYPSVISQNFKILFRPIYRAIFGFRRIKPIRRTEHFGNN